MSDDNYDEQFQLLAKLREYAANDSERAVTMQAAHQQLLDATVAIGGWAPDLQAEAEESLKSVLADTRRAAQSAKEHVDVAALALGALDITKPEHVGLVAAESEVLSSLVKKLRQIETAMRLIDELERRVNSHRRDA
jgi:coenzyme F420-reducing hydrogenase alpha subunit